MRGPVFQKWLFFSTTPMMNMYVKKLGKLRNDYIETKIGDIFMAHDKRRGYKSERLKFIRKGNPVRVLT